MVELVVEYPGRRWKFWSISNVIGKYLKSEGIVYPNYALLNWIENGFLSCD